LHRAATVSTLRDGGARDPPEASATDRGSWHDITESTSNRVAFLSKFDTDLTDPRVSA
jgi:hypothetical protein